MVPSGPPTGTAQSVNPSLLRSNSGLLGGTQAGSIASQQPFSSLVSPHTQFSGNNNNSSMSLMGNMPSVSSLLNHSFANGGPGSLGGLSSPQVGTDMLGPGERDPMSFNSSSSPAQGQHFQNPSVTQDQTPQGHHLEGMQNFHHHYSGPQNHQHQQMGRGMGNGGNMATVKVEPQMGQVKLEPQQLQSMRSLGPVKIEPQYSNSSMFLQQQQHQQILQMSRQSPQAAAEQLNFLHKQRMLQIQQQQQQQQILKTMPQNRTQIQQQGHQVRSQGKPTMYEPGMCARRLTQYMDHQQHRPEDNNIEFWRKFVAEHFAPNAKKRWCVSLYGSSRQTTGVFPQDIWHCEICNRKPGRGFETTIEVLPRLFQIKYASGTLEELLYVDMPHEYHNTSGQIVLDYAKAVQESVFDQLRVVREGQLRIVFSRELKIYSWEFCARRHEELIPRRVLIPQVSQLGAVVQKYQTAANASPGLSAQDLQANCNSFVASARQLAKALEVPLVNDLGYTKRYVRCLQISEVVNSMKDLIDYSRETGTGPMDSLINFPRRTSGSTGLHGQLTQQQEQQQAIHQNQAHNGQNAIHTPSMQLASGSTGITSVNNSLNTQPTTSMSATTIVGLLHQNSMNSRQENPMSSVNSSPYGGGNGNNTVQIPSATSSSHPNPSSPFTSPTPSTSNNNPTPSSHGSTHLNSTNSPANMSTMQQQATQPHEPDPSESQSSVQQIFEEMMMSSQLNGNGIMPPLNNGIGSNPGVAMGFGSMGANGSRAVMTNNTIAMNGRVGMNHMPQDPMAMNHHHLNGLGSANSFSSLHFDWKPSP